MANNKEYTPEQINFILDRTVKLLPREKAVDLFAETAQDFRQEYGVEDFGVREAQFVTDRYGWDPLYG